MRISGHSTLNHDGVTLELSVRFMPTEDERVMIVVKENGGTESNLLKGLQTRVVGPNKLPQAKKPIKTVKKLRNKE